MLNNINKYTSNNLVWRCQDDNFTETGEILKTVKVTKYNSNEGHVEWSFPCMVGEVYQKFSCTIDTSSMREKFKIPESINNKKLLKESNLLFFANTLSMDELSQEITDAQGDVELKPMGSTEENKIEIKFRFKKGITSYKNKSSWNVFFEIRNWRIELITGIYIVSNQGQLISSGKKVLLSSYTASLLNKLCWWYKNDLIKLRDKRRSNKDAPNKVENKKAKHNTYSNLITCKKELKKLEIEKSIIENKISIKLAEIKELENSSTNTEINYEIIDCDTLDTNTEINKDDVNNNDNIIINNININNNIFSTTTDNNDNIFNFNDNIFNFNDNIFNFNDNIFNFNDN